MSECKDCPHTIGDITERDCCFPDCCGGWEAVYKDLKQKNEALQAKIDSLMLEYCPHEMTGEQMIRWAKNQAPAEENKG